MISKDEILQILSKDKLRNINLINFILDYGIEEIRKIGNTYLIKSTSDKQWIYFFYESEPNEQEFKNLITNLKDGDSHFAVLEDWMVDIIQSNCKVIWHLSGLQLYFPEEIQPKEVKHIIKDLSIKDAKYIFEHSDYKKYISLQYIEDRIKRGIALGLYDRGGLIAWILTHDDGAMGFLNVLPEFRRKGYGTEITSALINRIREKGGIPFVHVERDNVKPMNLALKMGFKVHRNVNWLRIQN
ncbi:MAG: GNAT family N-acetyltransferase [Ignavibacteria bacterium]|nr:GNAT family N-acetyltransferase [Ignavibacteria bacterium]